MKTTIKSILNATDTLSRLAERTLPVRQSYRLAKLVKAVNAEMSVYHDERIKICKRYGKLNESERRYEFPDENREAAENDLQELISQEVELDVKPIDIDGLELTAQDIINIEPFIEVIDDD